MSDAAQHIYVEKGEFFFDSEIYTEYGPIKTSIDYEDGDMIKWTWEGKTMTGTLRCKNSNLGLFVIENIATY